MLMNYSGRGSHPEWSQRRWTKKRQAIRTDNQALNPLIEVGGAERRCRHREGQLIRGRCFELRQARGVAGAGGGALAGGFPGDVGGRCSASLLVELRRARGDAVAVPDNQQRGQGTHRRPCPPNPPRQTPPSSLAPEHTQPEFSLRTPPCGRLASPP